MKYLKFEKPVLSPSLLAADKNDIISEIGKADQVGCPMIHIDVMDGIFVPNRSFGVDFVYKYHDKHNLLNDVHLMMARPWLFVEDYAKAGADIITFHYEACPNDDVILDLIKKIHQAGKKAGISIKPRTPAYRLTPFLTAVDLVLIMSVEPGQGGQEFMKGALKRIKTIKNTIKVLGGHALVEVDGGINHITGPACLRAGADILVSGSYFYGHDDFDERAKKLLNKKCIL